MLDTRLTTQWRASQHSGAKVKETLPGVPFLKALDSQQSHSQCFSIVSIERSGT